MCGIAFIVAKYELIRTFHVLHELRVADIVLGLPWLHDEQATLKFGTGQLFTLMDVNVIEN
jgi:hypothetical protein